MTGFSWLLLRSGRSKHTCTMVLALYVHLYVEHICIVLMSWEQHLQARRPNGWQGSVDFFWDRADQGILAPWSWPCMYIYMYTIYRLPTRPNKNLRIWRAALARVGRRIVLKIFYEGWKKTCTKVLNPHRDHWRSKWASWECGGELLVLYNPNPPSLRWVTKVEPCYVPFHVCDCLWLVPTWSQTLEVSVTEMLP